MSTPRQENAKKAARRRFEARELLFKLKSNPCEKCGDDTLHPCQMDFIRKVDKPRKGPISRLLLRSLKTIAEDIANNYELLCANCARLKNWERQRAARASKF